MNWLRSCELCVNNGELFIECSSAVRPAVVQQAGMEGMEMKMTILSRRVCMVRQFYQYSPGKHCIGMYWNISISKLLYPDVEE